VKCYYKLRKAHIAFILFTIVLFFSCNNFKKNTSHQQIPDTNIAKGKKLAETYCQSCHMLPDPSLLDTKSWEEGVLPSMGPHLGIFFYGFKEYPSGRQDANIDKNYYPDKQIINYVDWQNIIDYYTAVSPDTLPSQKIVKPIRENNLLFESETPAPSNRLPTICFVKIDTSVIPHQLLVSDLAERKIYRLDDRLMAFDSLKCKSPIVDLEIFNHEMITCNIGNINPNDAKSGRLSKLSLSENKGLKEDSIFQIDKLARPVQASAADLNADGRTDYLICEFGNRLGALSWMENLGNNNYEKHIIRAFPGAIKAYIRDVNNDGLPDIWVLFAQGEEGIFLFTNKGRGKFNQEEVLRFPPVFGSTYFELADFNNDGFPDIVYTCGDNADFSPVLKPYHGVYIFINDHHNHFKQAYFFPMHGCFKAIARDFDGDGDLDIAAISFFADYERHPEESFVYLQNNGNLDFDPFTIPGITGGRWLTMDAGDLDGDGKTDLVIGNFSIAPHNKNVTIDWKKGPPFIVLKNIIKK
jgi:hypothetical protein